MSDELESHSPQVSPPTPPLPPGDSEDMDQLRDLIVGEEQERIDEIEKRLDSAERRARDVGQILPEAVLIRNRQDDQLTRVLTPSIEEALKTSVRRQPKVIADAIFPIMGPAIRKAIGDTLARLIQTLNQALEYSFSIRALRWRLEAWRTGRSFGEVVLLHTLAYRVEQIFLIHRETGLLLQHVSAEAVAAPDGDMVSGMLTAIQDFVRDSFAEQGQSLDSMKVGDLTVWIEVGPHALAAAVIRGNPPQDLHTQLQTALEKIHADLGEPLTGFEGDTTPFELARHYLESCLVEARRGRAKKTRGVMAWTLVVVVLAALITWAAFAVQARARWSDFVAELEAEPGIIVTGHDKRSGRYVVRGLRDPMAADPAAILQQTPIEAAEVVFEMEPFHSTHPSLVLARAQQLLQPPPGVTLRLEDGVLIGQGAAPHDWFTSAPQLATSIAGVHTWRDSDLIDADLIEWQSARQRIEEYVVYFERGLTDLKPEQEDRVQAVLSHARHLLELSDRLDRTVRIAVVGHTDRYGPADRNAGLSRGRAVVIAQRLLAEGIDERFIEPIGAGADEAINEQLDEAERALHRRVTFRVLDGDRSTR